MLASSMLSRITTCRFGLFAVLLALPLLTPTMAVAQDAEFPTLSVRDHEVNRELAAQGEQIYAKTLEDLEGFERQAEGGSISRVNLDAIGTVYVGSQQLLRVGERLVVLGEPAGIDLKLRAANLDARMRQVMSAFLSTPAGTTKRDQGLPALERRAQAHMRQVTGLARLAEEEDWARAEEGLYEIIDHLDELGIWYDRNQKGRPYEPFREARAAIDKAMATIRAEEAVAQIEADLEAVTPDFEAFLSSLQTAGGGLNDAGLTEYGGEQLTGPEVVTAWINQWQTLHQQVLQARALNAALFAAGQNTTAAVSDLDRNYNRVCGDAYQAVKELIAGNTNRADATTAPALHAEYVTALAPLAGLTGDTALVEIAPALDRLAARSPDYQREVTAYRAATVDYLRWQQRIAEEQAAQHVKQSYPHCSSACVAAAQSGEGLPGVIGEGNSSLQNAHLLFPLPETVARLSAELNGVSMSFGTCVGLGSGRNRTLVQYQDCGMAGATLPAGWEAAVAQLETGLLCDSRHAPLTLEAAGALASARRGDLLSLGASVKSVDLKGVTPFFATLARPASVITPLVGTAGGVPTRDSISEVILLFSLDTKWARHQYFLVTE